MLKNKRGQGNEFWYVIAIVTVLVVGGLSIFWFVKNYNKTNGQLDVYTGSSGFTAIARSCAITCASDEAGQTDFCTTIKSDIKGLNQAEVESLVGKLTDPSKITTASYESNANSTKPRMDGATLYTTTSTKPEIKIIRTGDNKFTIKSGANCGNLGIAGLITLPAECDLSC